MKKIVFETECRDDGVRCARTCKGTGSCGWATGSAEHRGWVRGPACLAAEAEYAALNELAQSANDCSKCGAVNEAKLKALIEAGDGMAEELISQEPDYSMRNPWDAALAAIKESK